MIDVSDGGVPRNNATCEVVVQLYDISNTVKAILIGILGNFDEDLFEQLLGGFLELDVQVTESTLLNSTYYQIQLYGKDGTEFTDADELARRILALSNDQRDLLQQAGFNIVRVELPEAPTTESPPVIPTRVIPTWAVAVIVVLNSVIIIFVLLLILILLWRRYSR